MEGVPITTETEIENRWHIPIPQLIDTGQPLDYTASVPDSAIGAIRGAVPPVRPIGATGPVAATLPPNSIPNFGPDRNFSPDLRRRSCTLDLTRTIFRATMVGCPEVSPTARILPFSEVRP